jgi:hypothetical protein
LAKIRADRLLKLAEHLETTKYAKFSKVHDTGGHGFDFGTVYDQVGCGTMACAMGELPACFPKSYKLLERGAEDGWTFYEIEAKFKHEGKNDLHVFFGIDEDAIDHLFFPGGQRTHVYGGRELDQKATPRAVAKNIRAFVAKMQKAA